MVTYTALQDGADYSAADWQLWCAGSLVQSQAFVVYGPAPLLGSGTLPAGRKASGYMVWEVPPTGEVRLSYSAVIFDTAPTFEVILRAA
jgi:hypothetical protein